MGSIFCPSCGSKSEYKFSAPNFCSKCGNSYLGNNKSLSTSNLGLSHSKKINQDIDEDDDEDFEDTDDETFSNSNRVPKISRLNVDIDLTPSYRSTTFGEILGQGESSSFRQSSRKSLEDLKNQQEFDE
jgi:hypothetical protein